MNLTDTTREARACSRAYDFARRAELRSHPWNFAIKRAQLAADTSTPAFGATYRFAWPSDCLRVIVPQDPSPDWQVEGRAIISSDATPLDIRYIADIEDPTLFDAMFCETLANRIGLGIYQDVTQSSTVGAALRKSYRASVMAARKVDAMESAPTDAPDSSWITSRETSAAALVGTV